MTVVDFNEYVAEREEQARPPEYSDESLALRFAERHARDLRYVAAWGRWLTWNGSHWLFDEKLLAFETARKICRVASAECNDSRIAKGLASAKTVAAVERLAQADPRLAATIEQWDADPWLLGTPDGVVNLRTGEMRPPQPEDYITKTTAVSPGGECSDWERFLERILSGDQELKSFLQRVCGYALTGVTREHALFFLYGTGANGKSVFVNTINGILNSYQRTAAIETFTASTSDRHPTDLAGLRGARLVTAMETEEGRRWAESKIKSLTGGDKIAARFMRQDFFEFTPQFKLLVAGNHKPGLRAVDEAMRRRVNLIPFTVTIPADERDSGLAERLKTEWGGILQWAIEGCLDWQKNGLKQPDAVTAATEEYLAEEDVPAIWLQECCEQGSKFWASARDLYDSFKSWAERSGEFVVSSKRFSLQLSDRGFDRAKMGGQRGFRGLRLRSQTEYKFPEALD
jgi:putative DNA primase/helicase